MTHRPDLVQLAVGEHVAVDEAAPGEPARAARRAPRRLMPWLSSRPPGCSSGEQAREVLVEPAQADVLEHADRADRVERPVVDVAVVLHADLDEVGEARLGDPLRREVGLRVATA